MKFWAVYVVYNPDIKLLEKSLAAIKPQIDGIIVVDNGGGPDAGFFKDFNAFLIREKGNAGIAAALNDGFGEAVSRGADCIISFDQDSVPPSDMVEKYRDFLERHPDAGEVGCRYSGGEAFEADREIDHVITSGAAIKAEIYKVCGRFRDDWFIDMVDVEYSWRIRRNGWKVYQLSDVLLEHNLGEGLGGIRIFGKKRLCYVKHNPSRWYYIVRNTIKLTEEYKDIFPKGCRKYKRRMLKSLSRALSFDPGRKGILLAAVSAVKKP